MLGVLIVALGVPDVFHSSPDGEYLDNAVVAGYVVMRVATITLWLRVARAMIPRAGRPYSRTSSTSQSHRSSGWSSSS